MTEPTTPAGPPIGTPTRPAKKRLRPWITAAAVAAVFALCGIGAAALFSATTEADGKAKPVATTAAVEAEPDAVPPLPPPDLYPTPKPGDIKVTVKVLKKECFGSAGCNITYRISDVAVTGDMDPEKTYEVSYQIKGAESPIIGTVSISGGQYEVPDEEITQTKRVSDKLSAVVTAVEVL